ncbi:hypothetical protein XAP6164_3580003 [Xanthomonas phaseoli pv. phaseoli]|nr:hypothetical protein XAP6164_3580003 [Xanthomonas phaseoli pv. phaseoli]
MHDARCAILVCRSNPTHVRQAAFHAATASLSGAVCLPVAEPLAAWMPPRSLHGRMHGVSASSEGTAHSTRQAFKRIGAELRRDGMAPSCLDVIGPRGHPSITTRDIQTAVNRNRRGARNLWIHPVIPATPVARS